MKHIRLKLQHWRPVLQRYLGILNVRGPKSFDDMSQNQKAGGPRPWIVAASNEIWSPSINLCCQRGGKDAAWPWVEPESGREVKEKSLLLPPWAWLWYWGTEERKSWLLFTYLPQLREGGQARLCAPAGLQVLCATQQVWGEALLPRWMCMWLWMPPFLSWPLWEPEWSCISQQQASNSWKQVSTGRGHGVRMGMIWE